MSINVEAAICDLSLSKALVIRRPLLALHAMILPIAFFLQFLSCLRDQDFTSLIPGQEGKEALMLKGQVGVKVLEGPPDALFVMKQWRRH